MSDETGNLAADAGGPSITIRKISQNATISTEVYDSYNKPYVETPEQRAKRIERLNKDWALWEAAEPALAALTGIERTLLDLHARQPNRNECEGCDYGGWEAEAPEWPCRTIRTIAAAHDIALPDEIPTYRVQIGPDPEPRSFRDIINDTLLNGLSFAFKPEPQ